MTETKPTSSAAHHPSEKSTNKLTKMYSEKLAKVHDAIDPQAIGILKKLKEAGFQAYLVGGGVRDLLVGIKPKDFDIATNALPNAVKKKVPFSYIIGRRFKLVHARRGEHIFEIATFRRAASQEELETAANDERLFVEENFFGNIEEDSFRRDFTVNALFYDPLDKKIVDFCNGLQDIKDHTLRMIGDPVQRLKEDPVRILRAIRLSQKIHFSIEPGLRQAIADQKEELKRTVLPRRREEWLKFFRLPHVDLALIELYDLSVFEVVLPTFQKLFDDEHQREEFLTYLRQMKHIGINFADNRDLIVAVLYVYLLVTKPQGFNPAQIEADEKFLLFCRDELGVFKAEVGDLLKIIQYIPSLKKTQPFLQKGERRRSSFVHNAHFTLALQLGYLSHFLTPQEFLFWLNQKEKYASGSLEQEDHQHH